MRYGLIRVGLTRQRESDSGWIVFVVPLRDHLGNTDRLCEGGKSIHYDSPTVVGQLGRTTRLICIAESFVKIDHLNVVT